MAKPRFSSFEQFVRTLHRRALLLNALEGAGTGVVVACGIAGVLLPIWLWQGRDALTFSFGVLAIGLATGVTSALIRRPNVEATVSRADEQLHLHDLLGTAWSIKDAANSDFANIVLAQAEARCRAVSPAELALNRYGRRAWTLVGLSFMFVVVVSMMTEPSRVGAKVAADQEYRQNGKRNERNLRQVGGSDAPGLRAREASSGTPDVLLDRTMAAQDETNAGTRTASRKSSPAASNGSGDGSSHTATPSEPTPLRGGHLTSPDRNETELTGNSWGAFGRATESASRHGGTSGGIGTMRPASSQWVAPWRGEGWSDARDRAIGAVEAGRVPDAYRDVVRDYFQRDDRRAE